ncbi:MAG: hypothetical protein VYC34_09420 [Planctomycetota bacterium]|nr:hypothetical protein [Planctomycetota bacterium]
MNTNRCERHRCALAALNADFETTQSHLASRRGTSHLTSEEPDAARHLRRFAGPVLLLIALIATSVGASGPAGARIAVVEEPSTLSFEETAFRLLLEEHLARTPNQRALGSSLPPEVIRAAVGFALSPDGLSKDDPTTSCERRWFEFYLCLEAGRLDCIVPDC